MIQKPAMYYSQVLRDASREQNVASAQHCNLVQYLPDGVVTDGIQSSSFYVVGVDLAGLEEYETWNVFLGWPIDGNEINLNLVKHEILDFVLSDYEPEPILPHCDFLNVLWYWKKKLVGLLYFLFHFAVAASSLVMSRKNRNIIRLFAIFKSMQHVEL